MISDLMLYATKVALLLGLGALVLERVAAWRGLPRRGVWAAAVLLSLAVPTVGLLIPRQAIAPRSFAIQLAPSWVANPSVSTAEIRAPEAPRRGAITSGPQRWSWPARSSLEHVLLTLWLAASGALLTFYVLVGLRLRVAAHRGRCERIDGHPVWVTEALGPAVHGLIRPVILIPQWVLEAPSRIRSLVLAHEQEHIAARDPALVLLGLALVVIAPWNVLLWWQLQRLRFAVEVDCDARVLRGGEDAAAYGEVLLAVGERRTRMPLGALSLIEPASQLLQRIRIMTGGFPKRGKWAIASAVVLSLTSLAVAAQLQAPILHFASSSRDVAVAELRKPPPGEDPRLAHVQKLVRATYPELFSASAPSTPVLVTLLLNEDGTLQKSFKEGIAPTPWIATSLYALEQMGAGCEQRGRGVKVRMPAGSRGQSAVDVRAWYLRPPADPARDVAKVCAQVKARYASLFGPTYADGSRVIREGANLLTVYMTETGEIDRARVEQSAAVDPETLAIPQHFVAMGIARERIGLIGTTEVSVGHFTHERGTRTLRVIYAWPRRPDEPVGEHEPPEQPASAGANDDPAVNRAIAERYFPDLYTYPKEWPRADPWVLLDRAGHVLRTGRRVVMSGRDIQLYVESLYPGIRTDQVQVTTVQGSQGRRADVGFVWLAADSPITELSKVDVSERKAVLLYADVVGEGMTRPTELSALKVGAPVVLVASLRNPFGVVHVEVMPDEIATDAITVRARVQHAPLPTTAEIPNAVPTAWPLESAPVRAPYGGSTDITVTDQSGERWKIVLHPERLEPAAS